MAGRLAAPVRERAITKMKQYKLEATLDLSELDTLLGLLSHEITQHTLEAKLQFIAGDIDKSRYEWHQRHAEFLKSIQAKLDVTQPGGTKLKVT